MTRRLNVGDTIVYANGWRDLVTGTPLLNGRMHYFVEPQGDDRKVLTASDAFKAVAEIDRLIDAGVFTFERGEQS